MSGHCQFDTETDFGRLDHRTFEKHNVIDAACFAAMPVGTTFINVGRGITVDDRALADALAAGGVGAAWLDVFRDEPLPADSPWWATPNVNVTPHVAAVSYPADVVRVFLANLRRFHARAPLEGFLHQHSELDTLGIDQPESRCKPD